MAFLSAILGLLILALPFIAAFVIIIQVACEVAANRKRRRHMTFADREAVVKISEVARYLAENNEPELAIALAVYVARKSGQTIDVAQLDALMAKIAESSPATHI